MKKGSPSTPASKVSPDIVYQEAYAELRRYRDYELTFSTWSTTILLALAGAVFTAKFATPSSAISQLLMSSNSVKLTISFIIVFVAYSGMFSASYVASRYAEWKKYVSENLEPPWRAFSPKPRRLRPYHLILANQIILVLLAVWAIWAPV